MDKPLTKWEAGQELVKVSDCLFNAIEELKNYPDPDLQYAVMKAREIVVTAFDEANMVDEMRFDKIPTAFKHHQPKPSIHVIEMSAYQQLEAKLKIATDALEVINNAATLSGERMASQEHAAKALANIKDVK